MRASETGRDECLTCVRGLRTGQDHPGGAPANQVAVICHVMSIPLINNNINVQDIGIPEGVERGIRRSTGNAMAEKAICLYNCTMREYSNKVVKSRAVQEI